MQDRWLRSVDGLGVDGFGGGEFDEPWGEHGPGPDPLPPGDPRAGTLTEIVLIEGEVVDVRRPPISGSGYECAALELARIHGRPSRSPEPLVIREPPEEQMLDWLLRVAGGPEALDSLDEAPLPTGEPLDLDGVPQRLQERLRRVDEHLETVGGHVIVGAELLTACRRLLVRAAEEGFIAQWRQLRTEQVAAAVVHCAAKANGLIGTSAPFRVSQVLDGLGAANPSGRSRSLAEALGGSAWPHGRRPSEAPEVFVLGDLGLLLGRFRCDLIAYRDRARAHAAAHPA